MPNDISDRIRKQLDQRDGLTVEAIAPLADEYSQECVAINERLTKCISLLKDGLRSEAIQLAKAKPNLMEQGAYLIFDELQEWLDILQFLGITVPILLDTEAYEKVDDALKDELPLAMLLKRHRQLAIGKAPLAWRLKTLRLIRLADPMNSVWAEDQELWEVYRLKQIPRQLELAIEASNLEGCRTVAEELESKEWIAIPDSRLVEKARAATNRLILASQNKQLDEIADPLCTAFAELNLESAIAYHEQWKSVLAQMASPPSTDVLERVEPAIEWIQREVADATQVAEHKAATAALENLLDNPKSTLFELEKSFNAVQRFDRGIDEMVHDRLVRRIETIQLGMKRRTRLIFGSIATVLIAIVAAIVYWQMRSNYQSQVNAALTTLNELKLEKPIEAFEYLEKLQKNSPSVSRDSQVEKVRSEITANRNSELARAADFSKSLEDSKAKLAEFQDDLPTLFTDSSASKRFMSFASDIESNAKPVTPQEKSDFKSLQSAIGECKTKIETEHAVRAKEALNKRIAEFEAISKIPIESVPEEDLSKLRESTSKIKDDFPLAPGITIKVNAELDKIKVLNASVTNKKAVNQTVADDLAAVQKASSLPSYQKELKSFITKHKNQNAQAAEMARCEPNIDSWSNASLLETFFKKFRSAMTGRLTVANAEALRTEFANLNKTVQIENRRLNDKYKPVLELLEDVGKRESLLDSLIQRLDADVFAKAVTINYSPAAGKPKVRSFARTQTWANLRIKLEDLKPTSNSGFKVLNAENGTEENISIVGPFGASLNPGTAIQNLAKRIGDEKAAYVSKWDTSLLSVLQEIFNNEELEQGVKLRLLERVMDVASNGSRFLNGKLQGVRTSISRAYEEQSKDIFKAKAFTSKLPDKLQEGWEGFFEKLLKAQAENADSTKALSEFNVEFVGGIIRNKNAVTHWTNNGLGRRSGRVFGLVRIPNQPEATNLQLYGTLRSGELSVDVNNRDTFPAGTPLVLWESSGNRE